MNENDISGKNGIRHDGQLGRQPDQLRRKARRLCPFNIGVERRAQLAFHGGGIKNRANDDSLIFGSRTI